MRPLTAPYVQTRSLNGKPPIYNLKTDPEETDNLMDQNPEVAQRMQKELSKALKGFENRPFGEFTK
jgi:hypothetical protein